MSIDARLKELHLMLPPTPIPVANYVPAVQFGSLIFASGQTPTIAGQLTVQGKLGAGVSIA